MKEGKTFINFGKFKWMCLFWPGLSFTEIKSPPWLDSLPTCGIDSLYPPMSQISWPQVDIQITANKSWIIVPSISQTSADIKSGRYHELNVPKVKFSRCLDSFEAHIWCTKHFLQNMTNMRWLQHRTVAYMIFVIFFLHGQNFGHNLSPHRKCLNCDKTGLSTDNVCGVRDKYQVWTVVVEIHSCFSFCSFKWLNGSQHLWWHQKQPGTFIHRSHQFLRILEAVNIVTWMRQNCADSKSWHCTWYGHLNPTCVYIESVQPQCSKHWPN